MNLTCGTQRVVAVVAAILVMASLGACAATPATPPPQPAPITATQPAQAAAPAAAAPIKAAILFSQKISGSAFDENAYQGLQAIKEQLGAEVAYSESVNVTDIENVLRKYADEGYDLIFGNGFEYGDPMLAVGAKYPKVAFVTITGAAQGSNVTALDYAAHEMGYVAGVVATSMTKSGKIGFITGMTQPSVIRIAEAYKLAAAATKPGTEVSVIYTNSWTDVQKASEAAVAMVQDGVDVLFHDVGPGGPAVIQTAKDNGVWAIGFGEGDVETAPDAVLTSPIPDMSKLMLAVANQVQDGTFKGSRLVLGFRDGVIRMDRLHKDIPADMVTKIEKTVDDITSGALVVPEITEISK